MLIQYLQNTILNAGQKSQRWPVLILPSNCQGVSSTTCIVNDTGEEWMLELQLGMRTPYTYYRLANLDNHWQRSCSHGCFAHAYTAHYISGMYPGIPLALTQRAIGARPGSSPIHAILIGWWNLKHVLWSIAGSKSAQKGMTYSVAAGTPPGILRVPSTTPMPWENPLGHARSALCELRVFN